MRKATKMTTCRCYCEYPRVERKPARRRSRSDLEVVGRIVSTEIGKMLTSAAQAWIAARFPPAPARA